MDSLSGILASLPTCAVTCLVPALTNSTCAPTDLHCICSSESFRAQATACILDACSVRESLTASNATNYLCDVKPNIDDRWSPVLIVFISLAATAVAMRYLARLLMGMSLWWDDWVNSTAMLFCIAYTVYGIQLIRNGLGTDIWAVPQDNITGLLLGQYVSCAMYLIARSLIRISIILFYMRIFRASDANRLIWGTLISTILICAPLVIAFFFICNPVPYSWLRWDGEHDGYCGNERAFLWTVAVLSILNDFWIMGVPLPLVAKLQLSLKRKLLISGMFCMGIVVIAISIYKATLINLFTDISNPTFNTLPLGVWAAIEIDLGVVCACMPSLPVLFRPVVQKLIAVTMGSSSTSERSAPMPRYSNVRRRVIHSPFTLASSIFTRTRKGDNGHIEIRTTIQQTNDTFGSETYLPLSETVTTELSNSNQGKLRSAAWS
ncbi:hypothetical protein F4677DRAFT_76102 [Hypoxylon crocopeplum]|nr:hypothetical protein F4677DRAFT_76102 [Hypoxylon crocopeplum]